MPACVVKSCKNYNSKRKKSEGITYHLFPRSKNRQDDWVRIIRNSREENDWNPSSSSTVCSAHFDDIDFKVTPKGLHYLVPGAIPKRLLSDRPETQPQRTFSSILQVPASTDKLALTGYCRLCAASNCDVMLNINSDNALKKIVVNMSNRLNINISFSEEHLPTTICSLCVKSLYTAYDFVVGIDLAQTTLNKIAMQQCKYEMPENLNLDNMDLSCTSLQQATNGSEAYNFEQLHAPSTTAIKAEVSPDIRAAECNFQQSLPFISNMSTHVPPLSRTTTGAATNNFEQPPLLELSTTMPFLLDIPSDSQSKDNLNKKNRIIDIQRKKLKSLNQKVRRLQDRNKSLKNNIKNTLKENIIAADLFNNFNRKKLNKHCRYSQATKKFSLTLNYYSPTAYAYVRQLFDTCLPHRKTLAKWHPRSYKR